MKMNSNVQFLVVCTLLLGLVSFQGSVFPEEETKKEESQEAGQEPEAVDIDEAAKEAAKPVPDVGYTKEEYDEFQKALSDPDLKARAEGLQQFIKTHPGSKLNEHATAGLSALLAQLYQQKDMVTLAIVSENFLQMKPDDIAALGLATEAFYTNKDFAKAAKYGEAFYAKKPSLEVARLLAHSFDELKNEGKFASYAEKCIPEMSSKDAFFYSAKLSYYYGNRKDIGRAAQHCQRMLAAYGEGEVPPGYTADRWSQEKARIYSIMGRSHYERKQFANAVAAYNNSLKFFRQNDEAYYYMGMSYWGANDTTSAMKAFAKAYSFNKPYSKTARAQLENLYKALNNGSLEGIDRILRAATAD